MKQLEWCVIEVIPLFYTGPRALCMYYVYILRFVFDGVLNEKNINVCLFIFFQLKTIFINKNKSDHSVKNPAHPERSRSEFKAFSYSYSASSTSWFSSIMEILEERNMERSRDVGDAGRSLKQSSKRSYGAKKKRFAGKPKENRRRKQGKLFGQSNNIWQ